MDPNNRTSAIEDDDNSWIPLSPSASCDTHHEPQPSRHDNPGYRTSSNKSTNQNNSGSTRLPHVGTNDRTKSLQQRLETRMSLKSNLVDHPIDLFWKRYLLNLAREVWALEWHIRLGFCMVLSGIAIKLFLFSTWYFWYPRFVFGTVAMGAATIYLDFFHLRRHVDAVGKALLNPENIWTYLQQLDSTGSRRLTLVILLIPTALEMRTLSFLSGIKAETGWIIYNIVLSCTLLGLMMFWFRVKNIMPRECLYRGLLVLYGSALWITIYKTDLARMPVLAAPFLTATGTILITYQDDDMEWVSRILRHALRLTLRDVLSSMGEKVSEDEMLQLAILRWLADYWASIPADSPPESFTERPSTAPASTVPGHTSTPASSTSTDSISNQTSQEPARSQVTRTSSSTTSRPSTSAILQRRHEVSWQELLPMLNVATDHMTTEVQMLQANSQTRSSGETSTSSGSSADPIESFHDMLRTLNVDERAEPAVRAYKRGVASFPPSQETAVLLSIVRRSPALLTIVWQVIVLKPGLFSSTMVLLPFVVMEYYRIIAWIHCCEQVKVFFESAESLEPHPKYIPSSLKDVDPMVIMLVGDSYNALRPPALLLVWQNVLNSVSALEVGLTAARCAETTAVAVQFAGNVLSLVQFGQEIHQHGLLHGLILMGKEAILYHTSDASIRHQEATKYTHAVMGAMDNAQKVARNIQTLANDEKIGHFIQPVVLVVCTLSGYGWLWGNETPTNEEGMDDTKQHAPTNGETVSIGKDILQDQCLRGNAMDAKDATPTSVPQELDRLSDLMDEIVDSYGRGQISQEEKDTLFEELSKESDSSYTAVVNVRSSLAKFEQKKEANERSTSKTKECVSPSALMEMILAAYYRGLIDQSEKTAFCNQIARLSDEQRSEGEVVSGMMRTLIEILENGKLVEERRTEISLEEQVAEVHVGKCTTETSPTLVDTSVDLRSDAVAGISQRESFSMLKQVCKNNQQASDEGLQLSSGTASDIANTMSENNQNKSHDAWIRFGMATLSVVVGGILMSKSDEGNQQQEQHEQQEQRSAVRGEAESPHGSNESSLQIEEIHEEAEEEWVSVPQ